MAAGGSSTRDCIDELYRRLVRQGTDRVRHRCLEEGGRQTQQVVQHNRWFRTSGVAFGLLAQHQQPALFQRLPNTRQTRGVEHP